MGIIVYVLPSQNCYSSILFAIFRIDYVCVSVVIINICIIIRIYYLFDAKRQNYKVTF